MRVESPEVVDRTEPPSLVEYGESPYTKKTAHASVAELALFGH